MIKKLIAPLLVSATLCGTPVLSHESVEYHNHSTDLPGVSLTDPSANLEIQPAPSDTEITDEDVEAFGITMLLLLGVVVAVYFFPFSIAMMRSSKYTAAVLVINLFLGWTGLGWVAALVVAVLP